MFGDLPFATLEEPTLLCAGSTNVSPSDIGDAMVFGRLRVGGDPSESGSCSSASATPRNRLLEPLASVLFFIFIWLVVDFYFNLRGVIGR
jgi:hypothetical protein